MDTITILILFGLALDICGAFLIVRPLLNYRIFKLTPSDYYLKKAMDKQWVEGAYPKDRREATQIWFGLAFLVVGFSIQMVGNYMR
ncbi:MAG: hypothetical protein IIA83_09255 [Thaumarchaeota archaeon]|nr:hypothetical protein [Nitrososphaerota archaeon]